jgi:hypothetical protein
MEAGSRRMAAFFEQVRFILGMSSVAAKRRHKETVKVADCFP